jgi:hypothetical protein
MSGKEAVDRGVRGQLFESAGTTVREAVLQEL